VARGAKVKNSLLEVGVNGKPGIAVPLLNAGELLLHRVTEDVAVREHELELRGFEPLTSSMPSTAGLCGGPALSLATGHARPLLIATLRGDW
jgi:hypothetical protein